MSEMEVHVAVHYFVINCINNNYSRILSYLVLMVYIYLNDRPSLQLLPRYQTEVAFKQKFKIRNTTDLVLLPGQRLGFLM